MAKRRQETMEEAAPQSESMEALPESASEGGGADSNGQPEGQEATYTDKKGVNWKRLMRNRFPTVKKAVERLMTLGNWNNYHYTQTEARNVAANLRKLVERFERSHAHLTEPEAETLDNPWEE